MGGLSLAHWIIVALVVLVLFGRGRISDVMGDFGKGIRSFKEGMNEGRDTPLTPPPAQLSQTPPPVAGQTQPGVHEHQGPSGQA